MLTINGTFLFAIISFLIFLFIIKIILFQPITKVINEREKFYAKNSAMEKESKEKSKGLLKQKEELLNAKRLEATNLLKETKAKAKAKREKILKELKTEVLNKIEANQNTLNEEQYNAKIEIKKEMKNKIKSIVSKILGENSEIDLEEEKINQYLNI